MSNKTRNFLVVLAALAVMFEGAWVVTPSGNLLGPVSAQARVNHAVLMQPGEVPAQLEQAVIAVEDERFLQHHGIDVIGLGRSIAYDTTHLCGCEGGSTITEQLVKDVYLNGTDTVFNKPVDMFVALKVEAVSTKREILAYYLSDLPTGPRMYGVINAACTYYHRPLAQLDLAQNAMLAGVAQAPSRYNPADHPQAAAGRRHQVLEAMVAEQFITRAAADAADAEPVTAPGPGC